MNSFESGVFFQATFDKQEQVNVRMWVQFAPSVATYGEECRTLAFGSNQSCQISVRKTVDEVGSRMDELVDIGPVPKTLS